MTRINALMQINNLKDSLSWTAVLLIELKAKSKHDRVPHTVAGQYYLVIKEITYA